MGIDEELLSRQDSEDSATKAGILRQAKRQDNEEELDEASAIDYQSLHHRAQLAKLKNEKTEQAKKTILSPIRRSTSSLLRQSWLNLIDTFGLTLIWINIHAFLHVVLGEKVFCKLGDEWEDLGPGVTAKRPDYLGKFSNLKEGMALGILDFLVFLILVSIIIILTIIVGIVTGNKAIWKSMFSAVWDVFKSFI